MDMTLKWMLSKGYTLGSQELHCGRKGATKIFAIAMSASLTLFRKTAQIPKPLYLAWNWNYKSWIAVTPKTGFR